MFLCRINKNYPELSPPTHSDLELCRELAVERICFSRNTVKILKIGTPEIITIIVLQLEQLDFTVQYCVQKMQTE